MLCRLARTKEWSAKQHRQNMTHCKATPAGPVQPQQITRLCWLLQAVPLPRPGAHLVVILLVPRALAVHIPLRLAAAGLAALAAHQPLHLRGLVRTSGPDQGHAACVVVGIASPALIRRCCPLLLQALERPASRHPIVPTASVLSLKAACPVASPWSCASFTERSCTPQMSHLRLRACAMAAAAPAARQPGRAQSAGGGGGAVGSQCSKEAAALRTGRCSHRSHATAVRMGSEALEETPR